MIWTETGVWFEGFYGIEFILLFSQRNVVGIREPLIWDAHIIWCDHISVLKKKKRMRWKIGQMDFKMKAKTKVDILTDFEFQPWCIFRVQKRGRVLEKEDNQSPDIYAL